MTRPNTVSSQLRPVIVACTLIASLAIGGGVVSAQTGTNELKALYQRTERLERELSDVQKQLYRDGQPRAAAAGAGTNIAARLSVRITELEGEIRQLTGKIEEMQFLLRQTKTRVDKLVEDVDFRLTAIERKIDRLLEGK